MGLLPAVRQNRQQQHRQNPEDSDNYEHFDECERSNSPLGQASRAFCLNEAIQFPLHINQIAGKINSGASLGLIRAALTGEWSGVTSRV